MNKRCDMIAIREVVDIQDQERRMKYDCISFKKETPQGDAYIILTEESPGKINKIQFIVGKSGSAINACTYAIAELVVECLNRGADIYDMIVLLSNITTSEARYSPEGIACRSIPEALSQVLSSYVTMNKPVPKVENSATFRPGRLRNKVHKV